MFDSNEAIAEACDVSLTVELEILTSKCCCILLQTTCYRQCVVFTIFLEILSIWKIVQNLVGFVGGCQNLYV